MQRRRCSLIVFLVFCLYYRCVSLSKNGIAYRNTKYDHLELSNEYLISEYKVVDTIFKCSMFCSETLLCMSFSFNKEKQRCRLHQSAALNVNQGSSAEGWLYYLYGENCPLHFGFIHDRENGICVIISEQMLNADDGEQFCTNFSSKLVTLETVEKQTRFERFLAKIPTSFITDRYRIGLHHIGAKWKWNNGKDLSDDKWAINEPNCAVNCDCGGVTVGTNGWFDNDALCTGKRAQSACEFKNVD